MARRGEWRREGAKLRQKKKTGKGSQARVGKLTRSRGVRVGQKRAWWRRAHRRARTPTLSASSSSPVRSLFE
uniref:Uncharacterized protein n=1 Tax=Aegilops tauschii subsp. strangulata TaxID=200361 RepID=A0A453LCN8_AEGTS